MRSMSATLGSSGRVLAGGEPAQACNPNAAATSHNNLRKNYLEGTNNKGGSTGAASHDNDHGNDQKSRLNVSNAYRGLW
jgi:hypothetical protein